MRGRVQGVRSTDDGAAWQYLVRLSLFIACHGSVCSRSQTLFGNAVRETPFRASLPGVGSRRETEFREMGSQTEFGNQETRKKALALVLCFSRESQPQSSVVYRFARNDIPRSTEAQGETDRERLTFLPDPFCHLACLPTL